MRIVELIWFQLAPAIQLFLLVLLAKRQLYRRGMFPCFFSYTLFSVLVTVPRVALLNRPAEYATLYWSTEVIYGVLAILVLNEAFSRIFRLDYEEKPSLRFVLPVTALIIITALFGWLKFSNETPAGKHISVFSAAFLAFTFGVHSVVIVLVGLFLVLRWLLVPGWNRYDYGILVGFGISAAVTMSARIERFYAGTNGETWYRYAPSAGFLLATLIWLHAFWPVPRRSPTPLIRLRAMLEEAERRNELIRAVQKWLNRGRRKDPEE